MANEIDLNEKRPDDLDFSRRRRKPEPQPEPQEEDPDVWVDMEAPRPLDEDGIPPPMAGPEYGPGPEYSEDPDVRDSLNAIAHEAQDCRACPLGKQRKNAVPGIGPGNADILFIGEAPGQNEDETGHPFTGQAGKLLDGLLACAGTNRNRVFITNMLKCRPPDNRDPTPGELAACNGYLDRQVEALSPKLIVPLGKFSTEKFIPGVELKELRSNVYRMEDGTLVMPVFHPAAALRRKEWRKHLIGDFRTIGDMLEGAEQEIQEIPEPKTKRAAKTAPDPAQEERPQASLF